MNFLSGMVALLTDGEAVVWVGMWQGLSKRQAYKAVLLTAVQLLGPCWLLAFLSMMTDFAPGWFSFGPYRMIATWFLVGLVVDAICIRVARRRLNSRFRSLVAQRYDKPD